MAVDIKTWWTRIFSEKLLIPGMFARHNRSTVIALCHTFCQLKSSSLQTMHHTETGHCKPPCFLSTSVYSALGVSAIMRYINRRFTYLLTYLLTNWRKRSHNLSPKRYRIQIDICSLRLITSFVSNHRKARCAFNFGADSI